MKFSGDRAGALAEWRRYGFLPFVGALGMSMCTLHIYSLGVFMLPLQEAFGWNRATVSAGLTVALGCGVLFNPVIGALVDRLGPRRIALVGVALLTGSVALLGTATGGLVNWYFLWVVLAFGALCVQPMTWSSAVTSRFEHTRGLALAITLAGAGLGGSIFPLIATALIARWDWRVGYIGIGAISAAVLLPILFLFFRGAQDERREANAKKGAKEAKAAVAAAPLPGVTFRQGIRSPAYFKLVTAGFCYSFSLLGLIVHLIPLLRSQQMDPMQAAGLAGLIGIFSVIGRIFTGFLFDRVRGDLVGAVALFAPVLTCALLLWNPWGTAGLALAAAILGLAMGSELDVITYLASRHFGLRAFGALFGALMGPMALGTGVGPLVAGAVFDHFGTYTPFILSVIPLMLVSAVAMLLMGPYPVFPPVETETQGAPPP